MPDPVGAGNVAAASGMSGKMSRRAQDENSQQRLRELEELLGYRFKEAALLLRALTHRSYAYQAEEEDLEHNESLEFLGDSILGFLVSARIFQLYPGLAEGELSKIKAYLVSAANLFRLAVGIRLGDFVLLGRGEEKTGGRSKRAILADAFEAIIAALYLDGGIEAASAFIDAQLGSDIAGLAPDGRNFGDFKSALQEELHNQGQEEPAYRVVAEIGPDHKKTFVVEVRVGDRVIGRASGRSKKEAQQQAARMALKELRSGSDSGSG